MITTTLGELVEAEATLQKISAREGFSFKAIYALAKLARLVKVETKFWHEQRSKLFEKLAFERNASPAEEPIHGPKIREISPGNLVEFRNLMNELNGTNVKIDWNPIKSTDLKGCTAAELVLLGPLCELVQPDD